MNELHMEFVIGHTPVADPIPDEDSEPEEKPSKTKENPEEKPKKVSKTNENPEEKPNKVSRMKSEETGKAGRPVKGSRSHGVLERWILENRPGVYKATKSSDTDYTYFCVPCDKEVRFFRDGVTYVTLHEKGAQHEEGLRCLGLSASGEPVDGRKPCRGVSIDEVEGSIANLTDSFRVWFAAGQPAAKGVGSSVTFADQAVFKATDDGKFLARAGMYKGKSFEPSHLHNLWVPAVNFPGYGA